MKFTDGPTDKEKGMAEKLSTLQRLIDDSQQRAIIMRDNEIRMARTLDVLEEKKEALEKDIREYDGIIKNKAEKLSELSRAEKECVENIAKAEKKLKIAEDKQQAAEVEYKEKAQELRDKYEVKEAELKAKEHSCAKLDNEITIGKRELQDTRVECDRLKKESDEAVAKNKTTVEELQSLAGKVHSELDDLENEIGNRKSTIKGLDSDIVTMEQKIAKLDSVDRGLKKEHRELDAERDKLIAKQEEFRSYYNDIEAERKGLAEEMRLRRSELDNAGKRLDEAKEELKVIQADMDKRVKDAEGVIKDSVIKSEEIDRKLQEFGKEEEDHKKVIAKIRTQIEDQNRVLYEAQLATRKEFEVAERFRLRNTKEIKKEIDKHDMSIGTVPKRGTGLKSM